jgi:hypothetical protein
LEYHDSGTYGHSQLKTGHPVRSAIHKQLNGRLVLRWVTTWESLLLYVLRFFFVRCTFPMHIFSTQQRVQTVFSVCLKTALICEKVDSYDTPR